MKTIDRLPNIYLTKSGEYYYSMKSDNRHDRIVERHVMTEYAFNFCARMNFNDKSIEVSRKTKRNVVYVPLPDTNFVRLTKKFSELRQKNKANKIITKNTGREL